MKYRVNARNNIVESLRRYLAFQITIKPRLKMLLAFTEIEIAQNFESKSSVSRLKVGFSALKINCFYNKYKQLVIQRHFPISPYTRPSSACINLAIVGTGRCSSAIYTRFYERLSYKTHFSRWGN